MKQDFGRKMKARSRPGRRKLSADQEQEVLSYVEKIPSISLAGIVTYVLKKYKISITAHTASTILARNGITVPK